MFVCDDFKAPIDCDFLGGSNNIWLSLLLDVDPATFRTVGHTNCKRYSVLNLDIVFLNIPLDSPAYKIEFFFWIGKKKREREREKKFNSEFHVQLKFVCFFFLRLKPNIKKNNNDTKIKAKKKYKNNR